MFGFFKKKKKTYFVSFIGFGSDYKPLTYHAIVRNLDYDDLTKDSFGYCRQYAKNYNKNVDEVFIVSFNELK